MDSSNDYKLIGTLVFGIIMAGLGLYFFAIVNFSGFGLVTALMFLVYLGSLAASILLFRGEKYGHAVIFMLVMIGLLVLSYHRHSWMRDYYKNGFILEAYIDEYPSWEETLFGSILGKEDWIGFANDCAKPVLEKNGRGASSCKSLATIKEVYRLDMTSVLEKHRKKMKRTAKQLADGKARKIRYPRCIRDKKCVEVPLLPPGVDADKIDPASQTHIDKRRAFWSLVNGNGMTPEICTNMQLCYILSKTGAVNLEKLK